MKLGLLTVSRHHFYLVLLASMLFQSCATYHSQFGDKEPSVIKDDFTDKKNISHTYYLIGDAGNWGTSTMPEILSLFEQRIQKADTASTLIFLGDNIYPNGMPLRGARGRDDAERKLMHQLVLARNFKGRTIFIPGNHDWRYGIEGLNEQEKFINEYLNKQAFLPGKTCGLSSVNVNESTAMIVVDSQWFLEDWDKNPGINEGCDIITREQFYEQLEIAINGNQNKTTLLVIHHPLMTNGAHGGEYSLIDHLFPLEQDIPLPIIGTIGNLLRKTSGLSIQDIQNKKYNTMVQRIKTLIVNKPNIVVISGHDHNLQYIDNDGIKQVISGGGSKIEAARAINKNDFSFGGRGYAELQVLKNGAAKVSYFSTTNGHEALLFAHQAVYARPKPNLREYKRSFATFKDTAIYTTKMTQKGRSYRFLWGDHFRKYYSMPIHVRQASIDTLYGGLTPTITHGIDQSRALRLESKSGKTYKMKALRKSATRLLQTVAFKNQSVEEDFQDTYTEEFILDFYTAAHPYAPFVVAKLAGNIGLNHTNPELLFIPKQNPLGLHNENFGDELYLVEELPTSDFKNLSSFGKPKRILTTAEVLNNIKIDGTHKVDEPEYIKARMFDMLIGDWDRGADQWSWGEFLEKGETIYRPIPLNRDQAFSNFDGALLFVALKFPPIRHMKTFDDDIDNLRWFNRLAYHLDLALLPHATEADWLHQASVVEKTLTDAEIDRAFKSLPNEVQDETAERLKAQLKIRKGHLAKYARKYYSVLSKTVMVVGTDKNDRFEIIRNNNETVVNIYNTEPQPSILHSVKYSKSKTKELWLYGLSGQDTFEIKGDGRNKILVRIMGGQDSDTYVSDDGKRTKIYDFKSQPNDYSQSGSSKLKLSNSYDLNSYDYEKPIYNVFGSLPSIGFNPDDGLRIGAVLNYTVNGFNRAPFSQKHSLNANYYFGTSGYEFIYKGVFPHAIGKWDFIVDLLYTSPNFSANFFGFGNETPNFDDDKDLDYNRVKIRTIKALPSFQWVGELGSVATVQGGFERFKVDQTAGRFITETAQASPDFFDYKNFADINVKYLYENYDNISNPTLGMTFSIMGGYKVNIEDTDRQFPYAESALGFSYRLSPTGNWVLATLLKGRALFDNNYEFYQAATVGGDTDLRGFRNQRFSGQQSFFQSTDIRWNLGKLRNGLAPVRYGIFGGYDYGRVWLQNDNSEKWHQSAGGGIWLNGINLITAKLSLFQSSDGARVSFGFGFGF